MVPPPPLKNSVYATGRVYNHKLIPDFELCDKSIAQSETNALL